MHLRARTALLALTLACSAALAVGACSPPDVDRLFGYGPDATGGAGGAGGDSATSSASTGFTTSSTTTSSTTTSSTTTSTTSTTSTGNACGDGDCGPGETPESCPADCTVGRCEHTVCVTGDPLAPGCGDPCVDTICAQNPYCCDTAWDDQCVSLANTACGAQCCGDGQCSAESCESCPDDCGVCPVEPTCGHSVCAEGDALDPTQCFDPCVDEVCMATPSCCMGSPPSWDGACTMQGHMLCGADPCVTAVCQVLPGCCTTGWSAVCVALAAASCAAPCDCAHPICEEGPALAATCDPCAQALCAVDPYCCQNEWDDYCVNEAVLVCGIVCN